MPTSRPVIRTKQPIAPSVVRRVRGFRLAALASALLLAGCASLDPTPLEVSEVRSRASADRQAAVAEVEPLTGAVTLEEAIARALKYNLDRRTRMMEEAIAINQLDLSRYDMLPKLVAAAGYRYRDEYAITRAENSRTGAPSLSDPYISSAPEHTTTDLGLTWSLLDFGLSYYGAKQNADRVLIAAERRRKAMHLLVQDVRIAFWRAASAQKLREEVRQGITVAESALADARKAEEERLRSPLDSLRYQRQLLENLRLLEAIDQELATARIELTHLINAPLAVDLKVVEPATQPGRAMLEVPVETLEDVAVSRNADLREQFYNTRIASEETRKALLRMFPNLSLNYTIKNDNDRYLINQHWNEAGAQLSWNLLNLLALPSQMRLADAGVALADQRRVATQMAILAQVHVARLQYASALQQFTRADAIAAVDVRLSSHARNRTEAQAQSKLEEVANSTAAILSMLRRYQALAHANAAASKLQASLGMEPELGSVQELSLDELKARIGDALRQWDAGHLPGTAAAEAAAEPVAVQPAEAAAAQASAAPASSTETAAVPAAGVEAELATAIERWRSDWESRDVERYLAHYSSGFRGEGVDHAGWAEHKRRVIGGQRWIKVGVSGLEIAREGDDGRAVVTFEQRYRSGAHRDTVRKQQHWQREGGVWKIVHESTV